MTGDRRSGPAINLAAVEAGQFTGGDLSNHCHRTVGHADAGVRRFTQPDDVWAIVYYLESLVPIEHRLSPAWLLGEERQGRMALHMGGMMGPGH